MSALPPYVWVMVLAGLIGTTATICVMLSRGALAAGLSRRTATRVASSVGIVWGAWVRRALCLPTPTCIGSIRRGNFRGFRSR
jgi:hypothetical protein